ncbi:MAG TPA: hypothetical protein VMU50_15765 [Polyangia bacterium]|nr:hypothetical protein [Polyangia bacterium]
MLLFTVSFAVLLALVLGGSNLLARREVTRIYRNPESLRHGSPTPQPAMTFHEELRSADAGHRAPAEQRTAKYAANT